MNQKGMVTLQRRTPNSPLKLALRELEDKLFKAAGVKTRRAFADKSKIPLITLNRCFGSGTHQISPRNLEKLAVFNLSQEELLFISSFKTSGEKNEAIPLVPEVFPRDQPQFLIVKAVDPKGQDHGVFTLRMPFEREARYSSGKYSALVLSERVVEISAEGKIIATYTVSLDGVVVLT